MVITITCNKEWSKCLFLYYLSSGIAKIFSFILVNSFHGVYGEEIDALYMDENIRRRDILRKHPNQTRLSYEDISQLPHNNNTQIASDAIELDFDSGEESLNFENGVSLSFPNTKKSSSSVTPR